VNREELSSAVRRVSILSSALTHQGRFSLSGKKLTLSSANTDVGGEAQEKISCEYEGDDLELGYKADYVQDILSRLTKDEVIFELDSPTSAGVIYDADNNKNDFLCLIMPLRLAE
jgi:DNA polymerase-3 subunit beta